MTRNRVASLVVEPWREAEAPRQEILLSHSLLPSTLWLPIPVLPGRVVSFLYLLFFIFVQLSFVLILLIILSVVVPAVRVLANLSLGEISVFFFIGFPSCIDF